jgi:hypothetical protein
VTQVFERHAVKKMCHKKTGNPWRTRAEGVSQPVLLAKVAKKCVTKNPRSLVGQGLEVCHRREEVVVCLSFFLRCIEDVVMVF